MKRLFIAINLPLEIKKQISQLVELIDSERNFSRQSDFRWLAEKNWHLTLTFLGDQPEESIKPILESMESTVPNTKPMIEFEKIIFGPPDRMPRMIWLIGAKKTSEDLAEVKNKLEGLLIKNNVKFKSENNRPFNTHLTLARFLPQKYQELKNYEVKNLKFTAKSVDLMESKLFRNGAEYTILEKVDIK